MFFTFIIILYLAILCIKLFFFALGIYNEHAHLAKLNLEEKMFEHIIVTNHLKRFKNDVASAQLITGECAIASDLFKQFCVKWRAIFGGENKSLTKQVMRTRRQALLNLKKEAAKLGATRVVNIRYEGIGIQSEKGKPHGTLILAYGTALIPHRES